MVCGKLARNFFQGRLNSVSDWSCFMTLRLDTNVQYIKVVGPKLGEVLARKGIYRAQDLLEWYPRAYEDRRSARNIASLKAEELVSLKAQVFRASSYQMGKSRRKIYDITLTDSSGRIHCKFFRVPYKGYFERFHPGKFVRVIGKVSNYRGQIEFHHPDLQDLTNEGSEPSANAEVESHALLPIYPESEGLSTRQLSKLIGFSPL